MATNTIATFLLLGLFIGLMILRVPIALAIGFASIVTTLYLGLPLQMMLQNMVRGINTYSLMAVPFFILMGEVMGTGGISDRLVALANALVGWMRAGLAMVNIVASVLFGAVSGSSAADCATLGPILIPIMKEQGYDAEFATNITMSSSVEGLLIPPSHNLVIYSLAAGSVSIGALFMAGVVPGLMLASALMIYSYIMAIKKNYPVGDKFDLRTANKAFFNAFWGLLTIVIVVIGVCTGFITATEGAALAVLWSIFVSFCIYRDAKISELPGILLRAAKTLSMIMILISTSTGFGWLLAWLKVPAMITGSIYSISENPVVIMLIVNLMLLVLGTLMDMSSIILIATPILLPVAKSIGVDPVHFGVIVVLNLGIGLLTPPVGSTLFIGSAVSGIKIERLALTMIPIYIVMVIVLMLVTFIPALSLTLPALVM
jgi:tripartite ATP-independent transporter DctM subunit